MDPSFLSGLGGFLLFIGFVAVIWFCQGWFNYTYCCGKSYNKRQFFCAVCNARVAGPCPACGKHQKWKGSGCMHCGHKLGDPVPISSPTIVRSIPNTSPSLTKGKGRDAHSALHYPAPCLCGKANHLYIIS